MKHFSHKTVLKKETIDFVVGHLNCCQDGATHTFIDATFGGGGHSKELLARVENARVIGLDCDPTAVDNARENIEPLFPGRLKVVWTNFVGIEKAISKVIEDCFFDGDAKFCGIIADLGTSQNQIESSDGFSIYRDKFLDMRMNPLSGQWTAAEILATAKEEDLFKIFKFYGEEPFSAAIARRIVAHRITSPIETTGQLAKLVQGVVLPKKKGRFEGVHVATRVFQALRIAVNKELSNLDLFLRQSFELLKTNGHLCVISFHSLEDRVVKNFFKITAAEFPDSKIVTKSPIVPSNAEIELNNCSRSAKLRVLKK